MTDTHNNFMNGPSYDINNPLTQLRIVASSCFFGEPMYYAEAQKAPKPQQGSTTQRARLSMTTPAMMHSINSTLNRIGAEWTSKAPELMLEVAIDAALEYDIEATLKYAVELRNRLNMRKTPQVIMVRAANHPKINGTSYLREYGSQIMRRLDDAMVQAEYQLSKFGKPIPSRLKRAWARRLESAKPYELAKYRREGQAVNIYDLVNISHPRPSADSSLNALMKGELKLNSDDSLKTWESIRGSGGSWKDAADVMGHMALLRNLRNLSEAGIAGNYLDKLKEGVSGGKQLPFRYLSAYNAVKPLNDKKVLNAIEDCIEDSVLSGLPHFNGRAMFLSDNSGSAWGALTSEMGTMQVAEIGNLMATLGAKASDEGYVGVFGDRLTSIPVSPSDRTFKVLNKVSAEGRDVGARTENGIWLFWDEAIRKKEHWDHVFVMSDMQAGHGGLYGINRNDYKDFVINNQYIDVPKLISEYRKNVNPNVMVYLIQTAGYKDTLVPEFYDRTFILGGWSEHIFHFAAEMNEIFG